MKARAYVIAPTTQNGVAGWACRVDADYTPEEAADLDQAAARFSRAQLQEMVDELASRLGPPECLSREDALTKYIPSAAMDGLPIELRDGEGVLTGTIEVAEVRRLWGLMK